MKQKRINIDVRISELEEKVRILEEENAALSEQAETSLLLSIISETLDKQDQIPLLLESVVEKISVLRNLAFCCCGELEKNQFTECYSYSAFTREDETRIEISIADSIKKNIAQGNCFFNLDQEKKIKLNLIHNNKKVSFKYALLLPFINRFFPNGVFLFAVDTQTETLSDSEPYLRHVVKMISEKVDKLSLIEELRQTNELLEERVDRRTKDLRKINEKLEAEIDEKNKTEEALFASEKKFRSITEQLSDVVFLTDSRGVITYISPAAEIIFGYSCEEMIGKIFTLFLLDSEIPKALAAFSAAAVQKIDTKDLSLVMKRKDGSLFYGELDGTVFQQGDNMGTLGVIRDVTDRKHAERELIKSEARYRESIELAVDGILIGSHDGIIIGANSVMQTLTGRSVDDLMNLHISRIFAEDELAKNPLRFDLLQKGEIIITERKLNRPDGTSVQIEMHTKMMPDGTYQSIFHDITERKLSQEALAKSERKFRSMIEHSSDAITLIDKNANVIYESPAVPMLTGYSAEERIGKSGFETIHPDDRSNLKDVFTELLSEPDTVVTYQFRAVKKDGNVWWAEATASNKLHEEDIGAVIINYRDISDRIQYEESLKQKSEELDRYFTRALDLLCIADTDGYFRRLNKAWENTLGYPIEHLEGRQFLELVHPDDLESTLNAISKLSGQEEILNFTNRYRCSDGSYKWIEWRSFPSDKSIYAIARDITDKILAEQALKESEEKYRILLDESTDPIFSFSPQGVYLYVNKAFADGVNKTADQITGKTIWDVFEKDEADKRFAALNSAFIAGEERVIEVRVPRSVGDKFFITTITPIKDNKGNVKNLICSSKDITERKHAEERLVNNEMYLQKAEKIAGFGNWGLSLKEKTMRASEGARLIYGSDKNEMPLEEAQKIPLPEYRTILDKALADLIQNNIPYDVYFKICRPSDGKIIDIHSIAEFDRDNMMVFGVIQDVTERKKAEEELYQQTMSLKRFEKIAVGRELKMIELKKQIAELHLKLEELNKNER